MQVRLLGGVEMTIFCWELHEILRSVQENHVWNHHPMGWDRFY